MCRVALGILRLPTGTAASVISVLSFGTELLEYFVFLQIMRPGF